MMLSGNIKDEPFNDNSLWGSVQISVSGTPGVPVAILQTGHGWEKEYYGTRNYSTRSIRRGCERMSHIGFLITITYHDKCIEWYRSVSLQEKFIQSFLCHSGPSLPRALPTTPPGWNITSTPSLLVLKQKREYKCKIDKLQNDTTHFCPMGLRVLTLNVPEATSPMHEGLMYTIVRSLATPSVSESHAEDPSSDIIPGSLSSGPLLSARRVGMAP